MSLLTVDALDMRLGGTLIQSGVSFTLERGKIFAIMGTSGCGKSTLLRHLVGLLRPFKGHVAFDGVDYWDADEAEQARMRSHIGMLFQSAALWSSMTLMENVCLPLEQWSGMDLGQRESRAREVLQWLGLSKFAEFYPADLSGGMKKRAGLARAIVTRPALLFLDEPSAGLDPISSKRLDDLVLDIRRDTGCAVLFVSHELPSLFEIADDGIFLDADSKTPIGRGSPKQLLQTSTHPTVHAFLRREDLPDAAQPGPPVVPLAPANPPRAAPP
jgi:phospholipid/cholesterol/gamma-HCH transport system ATP-binding protein